ncbi:hypothetical protein VTJ04DRAFT_4918 [Mycothermus thermophilus]|uniref:uncharacterized protein n=1 Tax=Humicola insolens TaxID=85995 RepID=UPI003743CF95
MTGNHRCQRASWLARGRRDTTWTTHDIEMSRLEVELVRSALNRFKQDQSDRSWRQKRRTCLSRSMGNCRDVDV